MTFVNITLLLTAITTALMAGFFYSYSISVSIGLGKLSDSVFLKAMQSINKEVQNSLFFICFLGTIVLLPLAAVQHIESPSFLFLLFASVLYIIGVLGVTVAVNVPLNNQLENFQIEASTPLQIKEMRAVFEARWNYWNNIRTLASIGAITLVLLACIIKK